MFLPCKCVTSKTKEYIVSRTKAPLVGKLRSIDDVSESTAIRRGLFNQGTSSYANVLEKGKFLHKKKVLTHPQDCWNTNMADISLF